MANSSRCHCRVRQGSLLTLLGFFVASCNLPPCLEGHFRVELSERIADSNCAFSEWPGGTSFTFETAGYLEDSYDCEAERGRYLASPEGSERVGGDGILSGGAGINAGFEVVSLEIISFEIGGCALHARAQVRFDGSYESSRDAIGTKDAFFVNITYNGGEGCQELFEPRRSSCSNAHPATVTRL